MLTLASVAGSVSHVVGPRQKLPDHRTDGPSRRSTHVDRHAQPAARRAAPSLAASLVALALSASGAARAQGEASPQQIKEAADEFDLGIKAAQSKDFESAASHFESADRIAPSAHALRAAIRARRDARQLARAATLATLALARHPDHAELATFARNLLDQVEPTLGKAAIACDPACVLIVDQRLVQGDAARDVTIFLDPGSHTISAGWGKKTASERVEAKPGALAKLSFRPPAEAAAPTAPDEPATKRAAPNDRNDSAKSKVSRDTATSSTSRGGLPPAVFYGGLALTGVLGGVTLWSGLDTLETPGPDAVRRQCVNLGDTCPAYQDGLSRQRRTNALAVTTAGAGVVTAVIGLLFTGWARDGSAAGRVVAPQFSVDRGGAGVGALATF